MSELQSKILSHVKSGDTGRRSPRCSPRTCRLPTTTTYPAFRDALRELMHAGRVVARGRRHRHAARRAAPAATSSSARTATTSAGSGSSSRPTRPTHEDLFIPRGREQRRDHRRHRPRQDHQPRPARRQGDVQRADHRDHRAHAEAVRRLAGRSRASDWLVLPDGNTLTEPILTPDAAVAAHQAGHQGRRRAHARTPSDGQPAQGVITEVLGEARREGRRPQGVIVQYNLPERVPRRSAARRPGRRSTTFDPEDERAHRLDLTDEIICTIDPDDAKDYDDAISLRAARRTATGSSACTSPTSRYFVPEGSPLDVEARSAATAPTSPATSSRCCRRF